FSGIKTAVLLEVRKLRDSTGAIAEQDQRDLARGFQDAVIDVLAEKTVRAAQLLERHRVVLGGGVACNGALQQMVAQRTQERMGGVSFAPTPRLATDNAAMI